MLPMQFVGSFAHRASQPTGLEFKLLSMAVTGLTTVLQLQQQALYSLFTVLAPQPSETQMGPIMDAMNQRLRWLEAAAALARVLHCMADAAAGNAGAGYWPAAGEAAAEALMGLDAALKLVDAVIIVGFVPECPAKGCL